MGHQKPKSATQNLQDFVALLDLLEEKRLRAVERKRQMGERRGWFLLIVGATVEHPVTLLSADDGKAVVGINIIEEAPSEYGLARALDKRSSHLLHSLARWAPLAKAELYIDMDPAYDQLTDANREVLRDVAWRYSCMVRMASGAEFLVPACSNVSWSVISAHTDESCGALLLEDHPRALRIKEPVVLSNDSAIWVQDHGNSVLELLGSSTAFRMAFDSYATNAWQTQYNLMAAQLWAGIEAIVGAAPETTYRITSRLAALLHPVGKDRLTAFKRYKELYRTRSKVVHGQHLAVDELKSHIAEVRELLARIVSLCAQNKAVPTEADFDRYLFTNER